MSKKRRDSKNRVLRSGESQRKDGRYAYKYIDTFGNPQFVYAWKLVPTDKTPAGKRFRKPPNRVCIHRYYCKHRPIANSSC